MGLGKGGGERGLEMANGQRSKMMVITRENDTTRDCYISLFAQMFDYDIKCMCEMKHVSHPPPDFMETNLHIVTSADQP